MQGLEMNTISRSNIGAGQGECVDRETAFGVLNNELANINCTLASIEVRLSNLRDRTLGSVPSSNKPEGPKPVPSGHIAKTAEMLDAIKGGLNRINDLTIALESIG